MVARVTAAEQASWSLDTVSGGRPEDAMARIPVRVQATMARGVFALPAPVRRRLAGRRYARTGRRWTRTSNSLLKLLNAQGHDAHRRRTGRRAAHDGGGAPIAAGPDHRARPDEVGTARFPPKPARCPARLYTPDGLAEGSGLLVFYHGGGG